MKKAQISVEYVLVIGFIIVALTIAVSLAFFYSSSAKYQIRLNQIDKVGKKIAETADSVYYLGYPSKATIDLIMPEQVEEILILNDNNSGRHYIRFKFKGISGESYATYYVKAKLISDSQPLNQERFKSAGLKHLEISTTESNYVVFNQIFKEE